MPERQFLIVVVLIFTFNGEIFAQQKNVENFPGNGQNHGFFSWDSLRHTQRLKPSVTRFLYEEDGNYLLGKGPEIWNLNLKTPLAKDFYSCNLSFFCRKELQIEKATSIPLRFRLGSLQYTDYLEQKPNAVWRR